MSEDILAGIGTHVERQIACGYADCLCCGNGHTHGPECFEDREYYHLPGRAQMERIKDEIARLRRIVAAYKRRDDAEDACGCSATEPGYYDGHLPKCDVIAARKALDAALKGCSDETA